MIEQRLDEKFKHYFKKGDKFFIVDLETVSFYSQEGLNQIALSEQYQKIPFLYLISSYVRNGAIFWAQNNLKYINKTQKGNWMIYCFEY